VINRSLLREQLLVRNVHRGRASEHNKEEFVELIDKWKCYLHNEVGIQKGDICAIGCVTNKTNFHAFVFALAELGVVMFPGHLPWNRDILVDGAIPLLKPELLVIDEEASRMCEGIIPDYLVHEMESYGNTGCLINIDDVDLDSYEGGEVPGILSGPHDLLYISYDDGLEDDSFNFRYYTHKEVAALSARNGAIFNLKDTRAIHTFNFIHAESFMTYFLPAYIYCTEHLLMNFWDRLSMWNPVFTNFVVSVMEEEGKKQVMIKNEETLENMVARMSKKSRRDVTFIYPYGEFTENLHRIIKKWDLRVAILSGEKRAQAFNLFCKVVDKKTPFEEGNVGKPLDNFYNILYNEREKVALVRAKPCREFVQLSHFYDKNEAGEYIRLHRVFKNPYSRPVKEILGHENFDILSKYGRNYLVVYEDFTAEENEKLSDLRYFKDIVHQSREAFCLDNLRCRYWHNLKSQLEYGFDDYETDRLRYRDVEKEG